jgi:hypothetical protein
MSFGKQLLFSLGYQKVAWHLRHRVYLYMFKIIVRIQNAFQAIYSLGFQSISYDFIYSKKQQCLERKAAA